MISRIFHLSIAYWQLPIPYLSLVPSFLYFCQLNSLNQMADILIIDDEKAIRKTLSEILSFEGYKIDEASDGEEGLKKFKDRNYDVVLCDIKMPKIDGIEFLQKAGQRNPDIPIIMISGQVNIEPALKAVKTVY